MKRKTTPETLKSAWQLAKDHAAEWGLSVATAKVRIIRMGVRGELTEYRVKKGSREITVFKESEVLALLTP